jgi:hypothetical protein
VLSVFHSFYKKWQVLKSCISEQEHWEIQQQQMSEAAARDTGADTGDNFVDLNGCRSLDCPRCFDRWSGGAACQAAAADEEVSDEGPPRLAEDSSPGSSDVEADKDRLQQVTFMK